MNEPTEQLRCRCGEVMELGYTTAIGLVDSMSVDYDPRLVLVVPGEPTSMNPIKAFQQGLEEAPPNRAYQLHGYRCPKCGRVELAAIDRVPWMT